MPQWSSSSILSGSSAAISGSDLVRRNTSRPLSARSADSADAALPSPPLDRAWMKVVRPPTRPGLTKSRIDHRSPRPFSIGVPVSARRERAGIEPQLAGGLRRRVLDGLGLVEHDPVPLDAGRAPRRRGRRWRRWSAPGRSRRPRRRTTRSRPGRRRGARAPSAPGAKRRASAAQLPSTAGGAITRTGPPPLPASRWARTVGVLPSPMSMARMPPRPTRSRKASQPRASAWYERSSPSKPSGLGSGSGGAPVAPCTSSTAQPEPSTMAGPGQRALLQAHGVAQDGGARQLGRRLALGQRPGGGLEVVVVRARPTGPWPGPSGGPGR